MSELAEGPRAATVERITLEGVDGTTIDAAHAVPDGVVVAGLVVHPDMMGLRPLFDELSRRLATHGFAVCTPEPWARLSAEERASTDPSGRMGKVQDLDDAQKLDDLARAADYLAAADGVAEMFLIGFCFGGMYTLKAAASGHFARAVPFYGMIRLPDDWHGPGQRDPLEYAPDVCPTLGIFGGIDPWTPPEDIEALRDVWRDRDDCEIVVYPDADHAFVHAIERPVHRPDDAADAWRRTLSFLTQ